MGKHYSGTMAHSTMAHHGGKVKGAGELGFAMAPGKAAMKTKPAQTLGIQPNADKNVKGMKKTDEGC